LKKQEVNQILKLIKDLQHIKGLVLTGGKSTRMGSDKAQLIYHGKPQKEHVKNLLENLGIATYYSVAKGSEQTNEIPDKLPNLGPLGGVFSAFTKDPNSAWFVLAVDLPFVNTELLEQLWAQRNMRKLATVVRGKHKKYPEPLIAIYEPAIWPVLQQSVQNQKRSLVKILMNSEVEIVEVADELIQNINTPDGYARAKKECHLK
jgi:molybdopterin-guanine dinucleotide biosynthesis protein A